MVKFGGSDLLDNYTDFQFEKHKDPERLECTCDNNGDCYWINFNDEDHGLSINDGKTLIFKIFYFYDFKTLYWLI